MATYLSLVKDLARESGSLSPSAITTVLGLTGRPEKMAAWVSRAYIDIQRERPGQWLWMKAEATGTLTSGAPRYTGLSFSLTRWGSWTTDSRNLLPVSIYEPAKGVSDEGELRQIDYDYWYARYARKQHDAGRPVDYAISPAGEMCFGPTPAQNYTVRFMYFKSPQVLAANGDVPEMPEAFHDLIVWEARRKLLISDSAFNEANFELPEIMRLRFQLECEQLDSARLVGDPIA